MPQRFARLCSTALLALAASACASIERTPGVLIASRPAGARVLIDGQDSGFVTPCNLDLEREHHSIDILLDGYVPTRIAVDSRSETWLIHYNEAWLDYGTWNFPAWLNFWDFMTPIRIERGYTPERIFVAMRQIESGDRPRRSSAH